MFNHLVVEVPLSGSWPPGWGTTDKQYSFHYVAFSPVLLLQFCNSLIRFSIDFYSWAHCCYETSDTCKREVLSGISTVNVNYCISVTSVHHLKLDSSSDGKTICTPMQTCACLISSKILDMKTWVPHLHLCILGLTGLKLHNCWLHNCQTKSTVEVALSGLTVLSLSFHITQGLAVAFSHMALSQNSVLCFTFPTLRNLGMGRAGRVHIKS